MALGGSLEYAKMRKQRMLMRGMTSCQMIIMRTWLVWEMLGQARREPQRGPGNHYRGTLWQPHSVCAEIETWGVESPHHPTRGSGSVVSSPSGVRSRAPKMNCLHIEDKKKPSRNTLFSILNDSGAPKCRVARENSPPPLDGPVLDCLLLSVVNFANSLIALSLHY